MAKWTYQSPRRLLLLWSKLTSRKELYRKAWHYKKTHKYLVLPAEVSPCIRGKVTIIKSLINPKVVYVSSLLPTPKEVIKQLNQSLFKFLWKGVDKVTPLSAITNYENGRLKMINFQLIPWLNLCDLPGLR